MYASAYAQSPAPQLLMHNDACFICLLYDMHVLKTMFAYLSAPRPVYNHLHFGMCMITMVAMSMDLI